jgi:hypothetical protein
MENILDSVKFRNSLSVVVFKNQCLSCGCGTVLLPHLASAGHPVPKYFYFYFGFGAESFFF